MVSSSKPKELKRLRYRNLAYSGSNLLTYGEASSSFWEYTDRNDETTRDSIMPSNRIGRINEDVKREISFILREVKDPRVKGCFLSVIRVEVTNDLSYCTVMVSTMEGLERTKEAVKGLESAAGFIRRELGSRLKLRHTPQMVFKATDAIEYGASINRILNDLDLPADKHDEENHDGNEENE